METDVIRIVAGIDYHHYGNAVRFLERLRFESARVHLIHVLESIVPDMFSSDLGFNEALSAVLAERERQGREELSKAEAMLRSSGYEVESELKSGDPSRCIIECAVAQQADLIAVGSAQKGYWGSLFYGSVAKSLTAQAPTSILVVKGPPRSAQGLKAVLATDHSTYCDACIERFLGLRIGGIGHITVLTSVNIKDPNSIHTSLFGDKVAEETVSKVEQWARDRNEVVCDRLRASGMECNSIVSERIPQDAIEDAMRSASADLLILGAQGHGAWDRLRMGSVSHFQVVATPHNVLVIRI